MGAIEELREHQGTVADKCREMGELLGLSEPVSEQVLQAALHDSSYAHNLLATRRNAAFLQYLLANPPAVPKQQEVEAKTSLQLVKKASEAMWKWAKTGFSTVDEAVLQKRYNTCMQCPNLQDQTEQIVYKVFSGSKQAEEKICSLCGCVVANKVRLPTEACPDRHPHLPGVNRWEEPIEQRG